MRLRAQLGTTLALLAASAAATPATVQACSPPLEVQPLFLEGASIPSDGVLAFHTGWEWQLENLLEDDEPLPIDSSFFHVRDVIRVESAAGEDVPGTLEQVEGVVFFRPASALAVGSYAAHFKQNRLDTWEQTQSFVVTSGAPSLPSVEAVAEHTVIRGDLAKCEATEWDSCGGSIESIARSDVDAARYALRQAFGDEAMRYQLLTRVTAAAQAHTCVGCDVLDVWTDTAPRPAMAMAVELIDLRSGAVGAQQLSVSYDGPYGSTPRTLTLDDFLATDCIGPPDGLADEWCDALVPYCEEAPESYHCEAMPAICDRGEDPVDGDDDDDSDDQVEDGDDSTADDGTDSNADGDGTDVLIDNPPSEAKIGSARGCSIAHTTSAASGLAGAFTLLLAAISAWRIRRRQSA